MPPGHEQLRRHAIDIWEAGVAGVDPRAALTHALATTPPPETVWVIAIGKAALSMADAAVEHLARIDAPLLGGLIVAPERGTHSNRLLQLVGDHPIPGPASLAAAIALGDLARGVTAHDEVWVLLSGGASSLIGAPIHELPVDDYLTFFELVGRAGLPIGVLNCARKRFARWGAGRLLAALRSHRVRVFALSDVPGDDPADIGSGPCEPDDTTASDTQLLLGGAALSGPVPKSIADLLVETEAGRRPETLKSNDPIFARRTSRVIGSNRLALDYAESRARALGYAIHRLEPPLEGEAALVGGRLATRVRESAQGIPAVWLVGGETTVALGASWGRGGRCQELALGAAKVLEHSPTPVVLLAAGTDGRDGPTDAAGAIVTPATWREIAALGIDPARALAAHDAYPALDAVDALFRRGLTGTNVMDVVVAVVGVEPGPS